MLITGQGELVNAEKLRLTVRPLARVCQPLEPPATIRVVRLPADQYEQRGEMEDRSQEELP